MIPTSKFRMAGLSIILAWGWKRAIIALVAGAPAIVGAWIGGFITSDVLGVLFFALAVGAALQVVVEVGRYVARRAPGGLRSGHVIGGYLDRLAGRPMRQRMYAGCSALNKRHMRFAWLSLFSVAFCDVYIRLCSMGVCHDIRII